MNSPRYWTVVCLMLLAAIVLYRRGDIDTVPPSSPLSELPYNLGPWVGSDLSIDPEVLTVLGKGFFLNREYATDPDLAASANSPADHGKVGLFIGYFPTQRSGQSIHSPQNCLPGAGWSFESSGVTTIPGPQGQPLEVGEYVVTNGTSRDEVLYWYQSHGRAIANDYKAKAYMLIDAVRSNRTDAALIRVITPVTPGESRNDAHLRAVAFTRHTLPLLPAYIPN